MTEDEARATGATVAPMMEGGAANMVALLTAAGTVARLEPPQPVALLKLLQGVSAAGEAAVHAAEAAIELLTGGQTCEHPEEQRSYTRATMGGPDVWDCKACGYAHDLTPEA